MTSSPHGPHVQGYTRATMGGTKGCELARGSQSQKAVLSSDRSLQLDSVKLESIVIADQHAGVNRFSCFVPSTRHTVAASCTGSRSSTPQGGQPSMVWLVTGVKS